MKKYVIYSLIIACAFIWLGCEYDGPDPVWNPAAQSGVTPEISAVVPENLAGPGVNVIKIVGKNFMPTAQGNAVYFNNAIAEIKSASSTELEVYRPNMVGDELKIKLTVQNALQVVEKSPYELTGVSELFGGLGPNDRPKAMAVDANDNVYILTKTKMLEKITPDGNREEMVKTKYGVVTDFKIGPENFAYVARKKKEIYRLSLDTLEDEVWTTLSETVQVFDWDANGNFICAGKTVGFFTVKPDMSETNYAQLMDFDIIRLRVSGNYVYVLADNYASLEQYPADISVWRIPILNADGDLGNAELVLDWSTVQGYSESALMSLEIDGDGVLYIGTDTTNPIVNVFPDGTIEPFYRYELIVPTAEMMVWGPGETMYLYRYDPDDTLIRGIVRMGMARPGAPYYGRR